MAVEYRYSTFGPRFCAGFIDGLVFLPINLLDNYFSAPARPAAVLIAWAVFSYPAYWIYEVVLHTYRGQTVGKKAQGVIVIDASEQRLPSLKQALLRDVVPIISSTCALVYCVFLVITGRYSQPYTTSANWPLLVLGSVNLGWFLLEIITMFTNPKRRALHDVIAGTVVVRSDLASVALASDGDKATSLP